MKVTDYAPRAASFDTFLTGCDLVGVEVGVDVGAHAQAMLQYCSIKKLYLVDPWPNPRQFGYCEGRLNALGFMHRIEFLPTTSLKAAARLQHAFFDFIYIDQLHDYDSVAADMIAWWSLLKAGGILGYRNYCDKEEGIKTAIDEFLAERPGLSTAKPSGEILIWKGKGP